MDIGSFTNREVREGLGNPSAQLTEFTEICPSRDFGPPETLSARTYRFFVSRVLKKVAV